VAYERLGELCKREKGENWNFLIYVFCIQVNELALLIKVKNFKCARFIMYIVIKLIVLGVVQQSIVKYWIN
jgi:predicted ferric reductase